MQLHLYPYLPRIIVNEVMNGKISRHKPSDLNALLEIWSKANALAHPFLLADFVDMVADAMATQVSSGFRYLGLYRSRRNTRLCIHDGQ